MKTLVLMALIGILEALHCDKKFDYYDNYGNGYDIICQGLTQEHIYLLENLTITSEISLTIENTTLSNASSNIFHNVHNIRYLHLENSTIRFSRTESLFNPLKRLEHLILRNTQFYINKYTFVGLTRLKELTLDNNNLEHIEEGSFLNVPSLQRLKITNNMIVNMKTLPLCEVQDLRQLNLSRNFISSLKDVHFYCRKPEKTIDFNLNNEEYFLDVKKRDYFSISDNSFKLTILDLSHNNISRIEFALADLTNLKVLNLESNKLKDIENKELSSLHSIEKIYLRGNLLNNIEDNVFSTQQNLKYLDISHNKLNYFSLNNASMLGYLNLANNMLDSKSLNNINNTKLLKTLILSNNKLLVIDPYTFQKFPSLETLDLTGNKIILQTFTLLGLSNLLHLNLYNNSIEELSSSIFSNLTNLRCLDLSFNRLKYFSSDNVFEGLNNLEVLNMSYNLLQELNYAVLEPMKNLNVLDIAGNQLHHIQYELIISDLPLLSVLNIKSNFLSCELLDKIIKYLKIKNISYIRNEQSDYEHENVAGIHCDTEKTAVSGSLTNTSMSSESYTLVVLGVVVSLVLAIIVIFVAVFKIHLFLKRRNYRADEFELIDE